MQSPRHVDHGWMIQWPLAFEMLSRLIETLQCVTQASSSEGSQDYKRQRAALRGEQLGGM